MDLDTRKRLALLEREAREILEKFLFPMGKPNLETIEL